jgi:hypothetical protein
MDCEPVAVEEIEEIRHVEGRCLFSNRCLWATIPAVEADESMNINWPPGRRRIMRAVFDHRKIRAARMVLSAVVTILLFAFPFRHRAHIEMSIWILSTMAYFR